MGKIYHFYRYCSLRKLLSVKCFIFVEVLIRKLLSVKCFIFVEVLIGNKMSKILKVRNVNDYSRYLGCKEQHPLVCVINYDEVSPVRHSLNDYGVYGIFFHDEAEIDLAYGCGKYDYRAGHSCSTPTCCTASHWKNVSRNTPSSITASTKPCT